MLYFPFSNNVLGTSHYYPLLCNVLGGAWVMVGVVRDSDERMRRARPQAELVKGWSAIREWGFP